MNKIDETRETLACVHRTFMVMRNDDFIEEGKPKDSVDIHLCENRAVYQDKRGLKRYYRGFPREIRTITAESGELPVAGVSETSGLGIGDSAVDRVEENRSVDQSEFEAWLNEPPEPVSEDASEGDTEREVFTRDDEKPLDDIPF